MNPDVAFPLFSNKIRRGMINHTFGMVRNGGKRAHQGWDFYAEPGTLTHAVAEGKVVKLVQASSGSDYGNQVLLEFTYNGMTLYAQYAHLSQISVALNEQVAMGKVLGKTGNTGNAKSMKGEDQHLHFEVRTALQVGRGLSNRLDPVDLFQCLPPLTAPIIETRVVWA